MLREIFLEEIDKFQARHGGMSDREFSVKAGRSSGFISKVRRGQNVQTDTMDKCLLFIKTYDEEHLEEEKE